MTGLIFEIIGIVIFFMLGRLSGSFFKNGWLWFIVGVYANLVITSFLDFGTETSQFAFVVGFIYRVTDCSLEMLKYFYGEIAQLSIGSYRYFFVLKNRHRQSQQQNSKHSSNNSQNHHSYSQEEIEKERARRAEEINKQREAEKARAKAEAGKDEHANHSDYQQAGNNQTHDDNSKNEETDQGVDDFFQDMVRKMHLATLGLNPMGKYNQADIKKAYQRQAKKYHPDRHQDKSVEEIKEMEARFTEVKRAYEWLKGNA